MNVLDELSVDVLREILLFLPLQHLPNVLVVNRAFNQLFDDETQWRLVYQVRQAELDRLFSVRTFGIGGAGRRLVDAADDDNSPDLELIFSDLKEEKESRTPEQSTMTTVTNAKTFRDDNELWPNNNRAEQQLFVPKEKTFPSESWKYNVKMAVHHRWSNFLFDREGNKVRNTVGAIVEDHGKVLYFERTESGPREYRIANMLRPIATRGTTKISFRVDMQRDMEALFKKGGNTFGAGWALPGLIDERILLAVYDGKHKNVYLGEFPGGFNVGYANNGYFFREKKDRWTDKFYAGDVISFIVDAEHGYKEAELSQWSVPYGRFTCLLNGQSDEQRLYDGIFVNPDSRIYFCAQVNEQVKESGITFTLINQ